MVDDYDRTRCNGRGGLADVDGSEKESIEVPSWAKSGKLQKLGDAAPPAPAMIKVGTLMDQCFYLLRSPQCITFFSQRQLVCHFSCLNNVDFDPLIRRPAPAM